MSKVDIVNLVKVFADHADGIEIMNGVLPRTAAERVRAATEKKEDSFEKWSGGIVEHCVIPPDHPYRALLLKKKIREDDALWTLGAIAYGTAKPWIVIKRIRWDDGREDLPDQLEKDWTAKQGASQ